jgi:tetratricopeptide (TPR) repeat protein
MECTDPAPSTANRERLELAVRHHLAGRLREAVGIYQELLRATPNDADLMQRLGVALAQLGVPEEGARLMSASLELKPDQPRVLLNLSRALLALGRAEDALQCCNRAVALDSCVAGGFRARGAALASLGRHEEGLANFAQAVRLAPSDPAALIDLGVALASGGRARDAADCFERAVELDSTQVPAHHNLGILAARLGDHARALRSFDRAIALQPQNAALHNNRGTSLKELGRLPEALESYSLALAIEPRNAQMLHNRAAVNSLLERYTEALGDYDELLMRQGERAPDLIGRGAALLALDRNAEALVSLEKAAALLPDDNDAHTQLGVALLRLERHAEAVASFDRALAIKPARSEVLNNRGVALAALGRTDEALQDFIRSATLAGDVADAHTNMGVLFKSIGRYRQAALSFDRALALERDDPAASFELGFLQLTLGEFRKGWPLYEARFRMPALAIPARDFGVPRWTGTQPLAGKTLLVHAEQGLGDTIQFSRYLPLLIERGAAVVFEVMPQLKGLMRSLPGAIQIVGRGELLPRVDYHCPLLSLPLAFDTQLATIPQTVPYLTADAVRVAAWAPSLQRVPGFRVGIAWQGNVQVERLIWARGRSIPLAALAPLADLPGVSLVSLQKGPGAEQLNTVAFRDRVLDLGEGLDRGSDAFLDTAAVMAGLDLVISSDTAIAHLAGALARPTWVALNASPDWRWLLDRTDSPWYPTMRLFRQSGGSSGWDAVVKDLVTALAALVTRRSR